ncbi:anti-anti-sigma regulatory factor [Kineococcus xinjiangensis]|uniref:Anti-anti-sigma regulatory factor n=1 Tax=Kineococcus xinjiangensis TaxID=512762 RepID=A0A2S6IH40_9ACTN|nr:STAS domain-containing protein [Kineococcus xinjiangensis]PPK93521.1 anti-anti-sigma regulatory factor [Kineococcus xinjiangensis]
MGMTIKRKRIQDHRVLVVSGEVGADDVIDLREGLEQAAEEGGDVLLDAHGVTRFDDAARAALVSGRSRAKFHGNRLMVLDSPDGRVRASLLSWGLQTRIPTYDDAEHAVSDGAARAEGRRGDGSASGGQQQKQGPVQAVTSTLRKLADRLIPDSH